jgi:hypothetical protein
MSPKKQVIRPVEHDSVVDFDDQLWPVNVLLLVLASCVAGLIAGHGDFESPEPLTNAWWQLGALGALVGLLALSAVLFRKAGQRRMQMAVLFSLLLHLWLSLGMREYRLPLVITDDDPQRTAEKRKPVTLPDYDHQQTERAPDKLVNLPLERNIPDVKQPEPPKIKTPEVELDKRAAVEPKPPEQPKPQPIEVQRKAVATPAKRTDPQLARRQTEAQEQQEQVPLPKPVEKQDPTQAAADTQRRPSEMLLARRDTSEPRPQLEPSKPTPQVAPAARPPERAKVDPVQMAARSQATIASQLPQDAPIVPSARASLPERRELEPSMADLARLDPGRVPLARQPTANPTNSESPAPQAAPAAMERSKSSDAAAASAPAAAQVARSRPSAEPLPLAATADQPSVTPASGAARPLAQPANTGLTKAAGGVAGLTRQDNLDLDLPRAMASASIPSAAARRAEATQRADPGTSDSASEPAQIAKSRAQADVPSTAIPLSDVTTADATGSRKPSSLEASSSAAAQRQASSAPTGATTANVGSSTIDFGTPTIVSNIGQGRSSGGGQPTIALDRRPLGKSGGGADLSATLPGEMVAAAPATGSSGGGNPSMNMEAVVDGPGRSAAGGGLPGDRPGSGSMAGLPGGRNTEPVDSQVFGGSATGTGQMANTLGPPSRGFEQGDLASPPAGVGGGLLTKRSGGGLPDALPQVEAAGMSAPAGARGTVGKGDIASSEPDGEIGAVRQQSLGLPGRMSDEPAARRPGSGDEPSLVGLALPRLGRSGRLAPSEGELASTASPGSKVGKTDLQPTIDASVSETAVPGLKQRDRQGREAIAKSLGGGAGTERAVELGLAFLARHQSADGSWSLHNFDAGRNYTNAGAGQMQSSTAGTGLALLSFLGAGYTHTDGKYHDVVRRGLGYLVDHQKPDGDLFVPTDERSNLNAWLYSHGIASIALCEAYGMTRDKALRTPAQHALAFIVDAQEPNEGGWRYSPRRGSDTSVSGWQVMALKSGELAGLTVPSTTYSRLTHWLDSAQGAGGDPSHYAYRPRAMQFHQREPSRVMTAEALLMRQYLGWRRDNPNMVQGARWIAQNLPEYGTPTSSQPSGQRDAYYWYYATQVMFQMQGELWEQWNHNLRALLLASQVPDGPLGGSWDPRLPVPDRWGNEGGRIYVTALHLLMLEVYYRHLPIYQTLGVGG